MPKGYPNLKEEPKKEVKKKELMVLKELPTQPVRSYIDEKGVEVEMVTVEEAILEILKRAREE